MYSPPFIDELSFEFNKLKDPVRNPKTHQFLMYCEYPTLAILQISNVYHKTFQIAGYTIKNIQNSGNLLASTLWNPNLPQDKCPQDSN
jgi:hypothetical protein